MSSISVAPLKRVFKYNGIALADPGSSSTPDQVRIIYSRQFPELGVAVTEGPVTRNGESAYTFVRAAGSKGKAKIERVMVSRELLEKIANGHGSPITTPSNPAVGKQHRDVQTALRAIVDSEPSGAPLNFPSVAHGLWG